MTNFFQLPLPNMPRFDIWGIVQAYNLSYFDLIHLNTSVHNLRDASPSDLVVAERAWASMPLAARRDFIAMLTDGLGGFERKTVISKLRFVTRDGSVR